MSAPFVYFITRQFRGKLSRWGKTDKKHTETSSDRNVIRFGRTTFGGSLVCCLRSDLRKALTQSDMGTSVHGTWWRQEVVAPWKLAWSPLWNLRRRQNVMIHVVIVPCCSKRYMSHVKPSSPSSLSSPSSKKKKKWTVHIRRPCTCHVNSLLLSCSHNSSRGDPSRFRTENRSQCEWWEHSG